ncbi:MAG: hypothetical protein A2Y93_11155 [Chloroflexi bacterium RBG_13_68_17]|nr:MAG: hypothetical protein A2Y93_11155 [Chloroflexi bacterium RBG_13_68_17]
MADRLPNYGGQALIEGVMMRGARTCAMAVRAPDGKIRIQTEPLGRIYRSPLAKIPFLRGLLVLWDALALGMRALTFSANVQAGEEDRIGGVPMVLTLAASLVLGISIFFLLPAGVGYLAEKALHVTAWWSNVIEGLVRLGLLVGYIWAIGRIPDIRRVFGYHGAEHKTIHAFEAGAELTPERVADFPVEHMRCGTAFLLTVVLFSILLFSALGPLPLATRLVSRLLLVPVLAAAAYEYIRLTGRMASHRWARVLASPNLALQRLTTREPEAGMLEVAIAAFEALRVLESEPAASPAE